MLFKTRLKKLAKLLVSDLSSLILDFVNIYPWFSSTNPLNTLVQTLLRESTHIHTHTYKTETKNRNTDKPFIFALSWRCWKFVNFDSCIITKTNYEKHSSNSFINNNNNKESPSGTLKKSQKLQNPQENTCHRVLLLITLHASNLNSS